MTAPAPDPRATAEMVKRSGAVRAAFLAHWPRDDWNRFKPGDYVVEQYTAIATAVAEAVLAERDATRAAEVARLTADFRETQDIRDAAFLKQAADLRAQLDAMTAERDAALERVGVLEGALRPFAKAGELFRPRGPDGFDMAIYRPAAGDEYNLCGDDLRRARAALSAGQDAARGDAKGEARDHG